MEFFEDAEETSKRQRLEDSIEIRALKIELESAKKREALLLKQLETVKAAPAAPVAAALPKIMTKKYNIYTLWFDGASKSNPGPSGAGWVLKGFTSGKGDTLATGYHFLGDNNTNNEAEYTALIKGLEYFKSKKIEGTLNILGDSNLVVNQVKGSWKCNAENLKPLKLKAQALLPEEFLIRHVRREVNEEADKLSNDAVKHRDSKIVEF